MAYLTDSGKKLLKEALFRLKIDENEWAFSELIGLVIGERISLLGCTNNRQSLNAVHVAIQRIVSEINELRTFRTETAVRIAKEAVTERYTIFFEGLYHSEYSVCHGLDGNIHAFSRTNTLEVVHDVLAILRKVLEGAGIMTIIHNQDSNSESNQPVPSTPPTPSDEQPVSA